MSISQHEWQRTLHDFELESARFDADLREQLWSEVKNTWHTTQEGQTLCLAAQRCWLQTVAWWTQPNIDSARYSVMAYATITLDFLDVLANDYVYRRNNTVPSAPLWDALDHALDMPALWEQLLRAIDKRRCEDPDVNASLDALNRRLSLIALARSQSKYPLHNTAYNATLWRDVPDLNPSWDEQDNPPEAKHRSLVRGLHDLPSSMASFYTYAATRPLPAQTITFLLDQHRFDPKDTSMDAVLWPWCAWLATLEHDILHWSTVQQQWPELAHVIQVVHALGSGVDADVQMLPLYRKTPTAELAPAQELAGLFDSVPQ